MIPRSPGRVAVLALVVASAAAGIATGLDAPAGPVLENPSTDAGAALGTSSPPDGIPDTAIAGVAPDDVLLRVSVRADASAAWEIRYRYRLDDPNTIRGFQELRDGLEAEEGNVTDRFERRVRALASEADRATDRPMVVENVSASARRTVDGEHGVVTLRFRWYGFANASADGDRLEVGDALGGIFLDPEDTLVVSWPGDATLGSVAPEPDERRETAVVWHGPETFAADEPRVVVTGGGGSFGSEPTRYGWPVPPAVGVLVGAGVLVGGVLGIRRWLAGRGADEDSETADECSEPGVEGAETPGGTTEPADEDGGTTDEPPQPTVPAGTEPELDDEAPAPGDRPEPATAEPAAGETGQTDAGATLDSEASETGDTEATDETAAAEDTGRTWTPAAGEAEETDDPTPDAGDAAPAGIEATANDADGAGPDPREGQTDDAEPGAPGTDDESEAAAPPEDLLSNEERVLRLLDRRGGRVKQQDVVQEFGWSETKTSEVVNDLREDDAIEVYRLGRENVLALPGESGFDI